MKTQTRSYQDRVARINFIGKPEISSVIIIMIFRKGVFIIISTAVFCDDILLADGLIIRSIRIVEKITCGYIYFFAPCIAVVDPKRVCTGNSILLTYGKVAGIPTASIITTTATSTLPATTAATCAGNTEQVLR